MGALDWRLGVGLIGLAVTASAQTNGLADLTIDAARLQSSLVVRTKVFRATDCAVVEGCVAGTGRRLLVRFDTTTPNIGTADLVLGSPLEHPELFVYSPCHQHYHFNGYAAYELIALTSSGSVVVVTARKQAFCLEDFEQYDPNAGPAKYTCFFQGISVGWQDTYVRSLDCQWLDVTDVPPGDYFLRVIINPDRILDESDYSNNEAIVPVRVPFRGRPRLTH